MSSVDVNIVDRTPFTDRTDPKAPKNMIQTTFQMPDGRFGTAKINASDVNTVKENEAIKEAIKKLPSKAGEVKNIKL